MDENMTYEQANAELKETVEKLSDRSISLAQSIELYGRACDLLAFCMNELDSYKGKITELHHDVQQRTRREARE